MPRFSLALSLCALLLAAPALAQPDWTAVPTYGTLDLETGFTPDPAAVDLTPGGLDEVGIEGCAGFINAAAPDVDLNFGTDGGLPLKLYVRSSFDTTILVYTPSGEWVCNDDDEGLNAGLLFEEPESGNYNIWIGTFGASSDEEPSATLYLSELPEPELYAEGDPQATLTLRSGFEPDPQTVEVEAGGPDALASAYGGCAGFVDGSAPALRLDFETDGGLPLFVYARPADGETDLTLAVMHPDGTVDCNDDAEDLNPGLQIEAPESGEYAVWVGSFAAGARTESGSEATVYVSELEGPTAEDFEDFDMEDFDATYEGGEAISLFAAPAFGTLSLDPGFLPDPQTLTVETGGTDANSVEGPGCAGFINNAAPDANVIYGAGGNLLAFYVDSDVDATLLVNLPNGEWRCSDDELGRNPAIIIEAPEEGLYNVWVGAFSQENAGAAATLNVSEVDPRD